MSHIIFGNRAASQQNRNANAPNGSAAMPGSEGDNEISPIPSATTQLLRAHNGSSDTPPETHVTYPSSDHDYSRIVHADSKVIMDTGYFSWIKIVFSLT